jgi:hypothetical protein
MRKVLCATAMLMSLAATANADQQDGTVATVDRANRTFTILSISPGPAYMATNNTQYVVGGRPTDWTAIKAGTKVGITYHLDGQHRVLDQVSIGE